MNKYSFLFLIIALLNYITLIYAENEYYIVAIRRRDDDENYNSLKPQFKEKIDILVNDRMNDIYEIIEENKNSYILENGKMDERLEELNESAQLKKRSNKRKRFYFINSTKKRKNNDIRNIKLNKRFSELNDTEIEYIPYFSRLVNHICPVLNYYAIRVLLSKKTKEIVCNNLENVYICEEDVKLDDYFPQNKNTNNNEDINIYKRDNNNNNSESVYYNTTAIKNETKWSDVKVQSYPYTPNHLALLSQSPFIDPKKKLDNNFYYPSSAGKDIDIYFIDTGLIVDHVDFDNSNRIVTCDALASGDYLEETDERDMYNCTGKIGYPVHGISVTSVAGGKIHGVAKNANLHMIAMDLTGNSPLRAMDFILQNAKPHKTVINMSFVINGYSKLRDDKLTELVNAGFIIVSGAGNGNDNKCAGKDSEYFHFPNGHNKTIVVGGIIENLYGDGYYRSTSSYGSCVDIFAPYTVTHADLSTGSRDEYSNSGGTSYSAPIVAGVIATIMSENPETEFDLYTMKQKLIEMSIKDSIHNIGSSDTPNRFINNGKVEIYQPETNNVSCGPHQYCSDGCCSKDGYCLHYEITPLNECHVDNGCQEDYSDKCITEKNAIQECEKEIEDNKECLIDITSNLNIENEVYLDERFEKCSNLKSNKCNVFLKKLVNNLSICSIVKDSSNINQIELIENYTKEKYYNSLNICENDDNMEIKKKCKPEMEEYKKCFIDENTNFNDFKNFGDLSDMCSHLKEKECSTLYKKGENNIEKKLPYCYYAYRYYGNFIKDWTSKNIYFKDSYDYYDKYLNFCENIEDKSIEMCNNILEENKECQINKNNNLDCNEFKSVKCQKFYQLLRNDKFVCNVAKNLNNSTYDFIDKYDSDIYNQYQQKCEMGTITAGVNPKWIYNASLNKCLYAPADNIPIVKDCKDDLNFIWYANSGELTLLQSAANTQRYLNVFDLNNPQLTINHYKEGNNFYFNYYKEYGIINPSDLKFKKKLCMSIADENSSNPNVVYLRNCTMSDDQKWIIYDENPIPLLNSETRIVWIYNKNKNKCLGSGDEYEHRPKFVNCNDDNKNKWEIPISGKGYYRSLYTNEKYCLYIKDMNEGTIIIRECNENSIMINKGNSIKSSLDENKCLGSLNPKDPDESRLNMNVCNTSDDQEWEIRDRNPSLDQKPINNSNSNTKIVWIYNEKINMCLGSGDKYEYRPKFVNCNDDNKNKWEIPISGNGYYRSLYTNEKYCLSIKDIKDGTIIMSECNENSKMINNEKSIMSSLDKNKCLGLLNPSNPSDFRLNMNDCNKTKEDQEWKILYRNPSLEQSNDNKAKEIPKDDQKPNKNSNSKTRTVWIYNVKAEKCLEPGEINERPILNDCNNYSTSKWEIPVSGNGYYKSLYGNKYCLNLNDVNEGKIVMNECNNKSTMLDINYSKNGKSIMSILNDHKCLGSLDPENPNELHLNMNECDNSKKDQEWEIYEYNPNEIPISTNDKCNKIDGRCPSGKCCSKYGWCGTTDDYCSIKNGCQSAFGKCNNN